MSNYIHTYFERVTHNGTTIQDIAQAEGERDFARWLAESTNTIKNLTNDRSVTFNAIILQNKDKEHKKIMYLNVANNTDIVIGDIINWGTEKWIVFQKEKVARAFYQQFYMIRCNYQIKWIDDAGIMYSNWCHFSSSLDSKVKENYRTWNSLRYWAFNL